MANIQLPLCKLLLLLSLAKAHIDSKGQDGEDIPENRSLKAGSNNLRPGALNDNRQCLLEVSSKDHSESTKRPMTMTDILQGPISCFKDMTMLHGHFIPDDHISCTQKLSLK